MRSDKLKDHMKVHQKYSPTNKTPQSVEDICSDMVLEIADKVVSSTKESSGVKRKYEEVTTEAQATIYLFLTLKSVYLSSIHDHH